MIVISKYIVPRGYIGLTLFPFIFLKSETLKKNRVLINHERIHLKQQIELLIIPFYFWYGIEFSFRLLQYKSWQKAYKNISFEREAFACQEDLNYLKYRPFWAFLKYISKHDF